jgi:hypothetical protein
MLHQEQTQKKNYCAVSRKQVDCPRTGAKFRQNRRRNALLLGGQPVLLNLSKCNTVVIEWHLNWGDSLENQRAIPIFKARPNTAKIVNRVSGDRHERS